MMEGLIKLLQHRSAEGSTGLSAPRNQGNSGVLDAAQSFLKAVDLFKLSVSAEGRLQEFTCNKCGWIVQASNPKREGLK
jgi:hypothetical protein